jgi:hypothetical protein
MTEKQHVRYSELKAERERLELAHSHAMHGEEWLGLAFERSTRNQGDCHHHDLDLPAEDIAAVREFLEGHLKRRIAETTNQMEEL